jgi:hypothetical protein
MTQTETAAAPAVELEIRAGQGLACADAARQLPQPVHTSAVRRWIIEGLRLPGGRVVKLEGIKIGSRLWTSGPALKRFLQRLAPGAAEAEQKTA